MTRAAAPPAEVPAKTTRRRKPIDVAGFLERYALLILFAIVVLTFSIWLPDVFATATNARTIASDRAVLAIAALATIVPLTAGQFDISIGPILGLVSIGTAAAMSDFGLPLAAAIVIGLLIGAAVGLVNGVLVAVVGINSLIATLATSTVIGGLVTWYTGGTAIIGGISHHLTALGSGNWLGVPRPLVIALAVAGLVAYILRQIPYGRYLETIGENRTAARLVGLRVDRLILISFVLAGALAAVGGILLTARTGIGNPQNGPNFVLPALAAAFLGSTTIRPGHFNVAGTVLAVYFVGVILSGLALAGAEPWVEPVFNGTALAFAVGTSTVLARRRTVQSTP